MRRRQAGSDLNVAVLRRIDSTNRLARSVRHELAADELSVPWAAFIAWEQTAGRGRLGRSWSSQPGRGVWATVSGRLASVDQLAVLPLAVGVALAEVLDRYLPVPCRLKWPNDLIAGGAKLGGILVEAALRPGGQPEVLVGFGINHDHERGELPVPTATSLRVEGGEPASLPTLTWQLVTAVVGELRRGRPAAETVARWTARSQHRVGDELRCRVGDREVVGRFLGLADDGRLRLEVDGSVELLVNAEIEQETGEPASGERA